MKVAVMDSSYNNTSRYAKLVEVFLLLVYRPLCELCNGGWVHVRFLSRAMWGVKS